MSGKSPALPIAINLQDIYKMICPACRELLLAHMARHVQGQEIREVIRRQFEAPPPSGDVGAPHAPLPEGSP